MGQVGIIRLAGRSLGQGHRTGIHAGDPRIQRPSARPIHAQPQHLRRGHPAALRLPRRRLDHRPHRQARRKSTNPGNRHLVRLHQRPDRQRDAQRPQARRRRQSQQEDSGHHRWRDSCRQRGWPPGSGEGSSHAEGRDRSGRGDRRVYLLPWYGFGSGGLAVGCGFAGHG